MTAVTSQAQAVVFSDKDDEYTYIVTTAHPHTGGRPLHEPHIHTSTHTHRERDTHTDTEVHTTGSDTLPPGKSRQRAQNLGPRRHWDGLLQASMSRRDDYPGQNPGHHYFSGSGSISAADSMPPTHAASSADPHITTQEAMMTTPLYEYPPVQPDGQFYPTYPTFFDFSGAADQSPLAFSPVCQTDNGYQYVWDRSPVDAGGQFSHDVPAIIESEGNKVQPQALWDHNKRTNPTIMGGDAIAMASPMSQYVTMEPMTGISGFEPLQWPPPPMAQVPPSPSQSQSSHYTSSPCSGAGPHSSRNNSYSSLPALRATNTVALAHRDAQIRSVREHAPSLGDSSRSGRNFSSQESSSKSKKHSSARQKPGSWETTGTDSAATASYNGGALVSPAVTPSPKNSIIVIPDSPTPGSNRHGADQQVPTSDEANIPQERAPAQRPSTQRARNRAAATKCRVKTKLAVADLESTERAMSSQHQQLSMTVKGLREEVLLLKNELLLHGNCNDSLIQQYLANQARMVGNGVLHQHQPQHQHQRGRGSSSLPTSTPSPRGLNGGR